MAEVRHTNTIYIHKFFTQFSHFNRDIDSTSYVFFARHVKYHISLDLQSLSKIPFQIQLLQVHIIFFL